MPPYVLLLQLGAVLFFLCVLSHATPAQSILQSQVHSQGEGQIYDWTELPGGYWTGLKVGTPPQTFKLLLDFIYRSSLFLPSTQCVSELCVDFERSLFNASDSATYRPSNDRHSLTYVDTVFDGIPSTDVAEISGITIGQQEFLDVQVVTPRGFFSLYYFYDGVLGLAPFDPSSRSDLRTCSIFESMVHRQLISSSVITIALPQGKRGMEGGRVPGSLRFGQPELDPQGKDVIRLPLAANSVAGQTWFLPSTGLDWDHGRIRQQLDPSTPVRLDPSGMAIILPSPLASMINKQFVVDDHFDCDIRSSLPNLVLTFEGSSELVLTPFDYTLERWFRNGTLMGCISLFFEDPHVPGIVLGGGVLEQYISEWDLDQMEVRLKRRGQQNPDRLEPSVEL